MAFNLIVRNLIQVCRLDSNEINNKTMKLYNLLYHNGYLGLPLFVGYDINGPLVSTEEASMIPYQGVAESMRFLSLFPKVELSLVTGWDNITAKLFASKFIGLPKINIVSEKGMVIAYKNKLNHLYPHTESEIESFANSIFEIASKNEMQISIQPNISSGCQCVYFEGFYRAKLYEHPLFLDTIPDQTTLCNQLNRRRVKYKLNGEKVIVYSSPGKFFNMIKNDLPLFPLRILSSSKLSSSVIELIVDPNDNKYFNHTHLKKTVYSIANKCGRSFDLNNDFSADFSTKIALEGGFSKDNAIKEMGATMFDTDFVILNVGDKKDDRVIGDNCLFFPQIGTDALNVKSEIAFSVIDGNEYSTIIGNYLFYIDDKGVADVYSSTYDAS